MVVETLTTLRIVAGLIGVGATLYHGEDDKGESLFKKTPEAIFGQVIGGIFYDFFKVGAEKAHQTLTNKYKNISIDRNSLNHDLQRAARKAQLVATFFAAQDCLEKVKAANLPDEERGTIRQFFDKPLNFIKGRDSRLVFLEAVVKYLDEAIKSVENDSFVENLSLEQFESVFDTYKQAINPDTQKNVAAEFKKDIIREFEVLGKISSEFKIDDDGFKILKTAIFDGWNDLPKENIFSKHFTDLSIINVPQSRIGKKYNWFDLVCIIFNEEYKNNPKVEAAAQKQMLLDISTKLNAFGTLNNTTVSQLTKQISDFADDLKYIREGIDKANEGIGKLEEGQNEQIEISREIRDDIKHLAQSIPLNIKFRSQFPPNMEHKVYGRNNEIETLIEFLRTEKQHPAIVGMTCLGKTSLIRKFLFRNYDQNRNESLLSDVFTDVSYLDCAQILTFESLLRQFNSLMQTAADYSEGDKGEFWKNEVFLRFGERKILVVFDNFESWQADGKYLNDEIKTFLETFLGNPCGAKGIFLSWFLPHNEPEFHAKVKGLQSITAELEEGLEHAEALKLVREEGGKYCGEDSFVDLDKISDAVLTEFFLKISYNPQSIQSMVHFIGQKQCTFREFLDKFQTAFDAEESDEINLNDKRNKILRPAKALIKLQISLLNKKAEKLLHHTAFYGIDVPQDILVSDLENIENDSEENRRQLNRLANDRLIIRTINSNDQEPFAVYNLHPFVRQAIENNLHDFTESHKIYLGNLANRMDAKCHNAFDNKLLYKQLALAECWEKLEDYLLYILNLSERQITRDSVDFWIALATQQIAGVLSVSLTDDQRKSLREKSEKLYLEYIKKYPNDARAYYNLGILLAKDDSRRAEAEEKYNKAIELDPNYANAYINLGILLAKDDSRRAEAEEKYNKAIELDPNHAKAYVNLGILLAEDDSRQAEAEEKYNKAIEFDPNYANAYINLGFLLAEDENRQAEAEEKYNKAIELNPNDAMVYYNLGFLLAKNENRRAEAEAKYNKAIEFDPNYANAYYNLGNLLAEDDSRRAEAEEKYNKAIEFDPNYARAYYNLGILIAEDKSRQAEAEAKYIKAIEIDPNYANAYYNLALLIGKDANRLDISLQFAQKANELNPELKFNPYVNLYIGIVILLIIGIVVILVLGTLIYYLFIR